MRIISKHKDYYDGGLAHGIDTDRIFVRNKVSLPIKQVKQDLSNTLNDLQLPKGYFIVGFCGEIILARDLSVELFVDPSNKFKYIVFGNDCVYYNTRERKTEFKLGVSNYKDHDIFLDTELKKEGPSWLRRWSPIAIIRKTLEDCNKIFNELSYHYRVPYWLLTKEELILNPILKNIRFYTEVDVYQTFQRIDQFLGNNLARDTEVDVPVGGNDVVMRSKGFDDKSFKKDPGTKKRTRRLGKFSKKH
jgi:hypothetical protein